MSQDHSTNGGSAANLADDLLVGAPAIAKYTGLKERTVYYAHKTRALPTFNFGTSIAARKSELNSGLSAKAAK